MRPLSPTTQRVAARLEAAGLEAQLRRFESPVPTATAAAARLGCEVGAIANSLIFEADGLPLLVMASGAHRVDTKRVGRSLGKGHVRRASPAFVLAHTAQQVGGVAPIGHPIAIATVVDVELALHRTLWAGAGDEHTMFALTYEQLLNLTGGTPLEVA